MGKDLELLEELKQSDNKELIVALRSLSLPESRKDRPAVYRKFLAAQLVVPGELRDQGAAGRAAACVMKEMAPGIEAVLVFSDDWHLLRWNTRGGDVLMMTGAKVLEMALHNQWQGICINLAGPTGCWFNAAQMMQMQVLLA